jgi:hypothetical protein
VINDEKIAFTETAIIYDEQVTDIGLTSVSILSAVFDLILFILPFLTAVQIINN